MTAPLLVVASVYAQNVPSDLPDFSRAGYREGAADPPHLPPTVNVRDFGGVGDGKVDDTAALLKAVETVSAKGGVVRIPAGRWVLRDPLRIRSDGVVLQGEGSARTVLFCPRSICDVHGIAEVPGGGMVGSGGFLTAEAPPEGRTVARVTGAAAAGERTLAIRPEPGEAPPVPGEWLELLWHNDTGKDTLLDHLFGGLVPRERMGEELRTDTGPRVRDWVEIGSSAAGAVTLRRPLRIDVRPEWTPVLVRRRPLREVGVEGLTVEFPETPFPGHLKERGYNGVSFEGVVDGWIRDVTTVHADNGVYVGSSSRVTARDLVLRGRMMHHGLTVSRSTDCLVTGWRLEAPHVHGVTITFNDSGNVYAKGWGRDLAIDAHRAAAFLNLFTDITIVCGEKILNPMRSGGSDPRGPHAARGNVYWNIRFEFPDVKKPVRLGPYDEWPLAVFAGWRGNRPIVLETAKGMKQRVLFLNEKPPVEDLYEYQRRKRQ